MPCSKCKFKTCIKDDCPHWAEVQSMPYIYPTSLSHIPTDVLLDELKNRMNGKRCNFVEKTAL